MLHLLVVALAASSLLPARDTIPVSLAPDTAAVLEASGIVSTTPSDTVRKRAKAVEVDPNYELRLRIHRYASYTTVPLFALQSIAGNQLFQNGGSHGAPGWATSGHSIGAAGLGVLFTVNTVTGVWNLWSTRDQTDGRAKRIAHSVLMLASDGGFFYTGLVSAGDANHSLDARRNHRDWAYASMGTALVGYGIMLIGNH